MRSHLLSAQRSSRSKVSIAVVTCAVVLVVLSTLLLGCGDEASLTGTWVSPDLGSIQFMDDGTMIADIFEGMNPSYEIVDGQMVVSSMGVELVTLDFTVEGDTLTINDPETGAPEIFTRQ